MWATLKVLLTFGVLFLFLIGLTGCSGGGISLIVSDINGPAVVNELGFGEYSVEAGGDTGIKYSWHSNPSDAGEFYPPDQSKTRFTAYETLVDIPVEIWVIITADGEGPIIKKFNLTIKAVPGVSVSEILGPYETAENTSETYRILASGDSGFTYEWFTNISDLCEFGSPNSHETDVTFGEVSKNTLVEIRVTVTPDNYQPAWRTMVVTIIADPVYYLGGITGPGEIEEYQTEIYSIELNYGEGKTFEWWCSPEDAGAFEPTDAAITEFTASSVCYDEPIEINLSVYSTDIDVEARSLGVALLDVESQWVKHWLSDGYGLLKSFGVVLDSQSNIYVGSVCKYNTPDFNPGPGVVNFGVPCTVLSKFLPNGDFVWARELKEEVFGMAITIDEMDNIYITGYFTGLCDFHPGIGQDNRTAFGATWDNPALFICKFDSEGNVGSTITWGGYYDVSESQIKGGGITVDAQGSIFVTGSYKGLVDFDPGPGELWLTSTKDGGSSTQYCTRDIFMLKMDLLGNLQWVRDFRGIGNNHGWAILTGDDGGVYFTGWFRDTIDLDPGPDTWSFMGTYYHGSTFLAETDSEGYPIWVQKWGSGNDTNNTWNIANALACDTEGNVYVTGSMVGNVNFDPAFGQYFMLDSADGAGFVSKYNSQGGFLHAVQFGGDQYVSFGSTAAGEDIAIDSDNNIYVSGYSKYTFDFAGETLDGIGTVLKYDHDLNPVWGCNQGEIDPWILYKEGHCPGITTDNNGNVFISGWVNARADFAPGECTDWIETGSLDFAIFLSMLPMDGRW